MIKQKIEQLKNYQPKVYAVLIVLAIIFLAAVNVNALLLSNRVSGYIVLDVENHGEAWYIFPDNNMRYYLGRPSDSFEVMRNLSVGASNENLNKIPIGVVYSGSIDSDSDGLSDDLEKAIGTDQNKIDTDGDGYNDKDEIDSGHSPLGDGILVYDNELINRVAGKILLQVEGNGEAWYISPQTKKRYYLGRPKDAFWIMRNLGLGITSSDLDKIASNVNLNTNSSSNISSAIPKSYDECVARRGENVLNELSCWWIPKKRSDINKCKEVENFWNGPEAECALIYDDPNFVFPEDIEQCLAMKGAGSWQGERETVCTVMILENNIYNKETLNSLEQNCPGTYSPERGCFQMFKKYNKTIFALPKSYKECEEIGGTIFKTGVQSKNSCIIIFNKVDYPLLYQDCLDKGGEHNDKIAGARGLGEGCSVKFEE